MNGRPTSIAARWLAGRSAGLDCCDETRGEAEQIESAEPT
jgi:hypothetical protein